MRRLPCGPLFFLYVVLLAASSLAGCNPSLNWREIRMKESPFVALMPCKPEASSRQVNLAGQMVEIHLSSCRADNATFGIALAQLAPGSSVSQLVTAQNHWRAATLRNIGLPPNQNPLPQTVKESPLNVAGLAAPQFLVTATGKQPGGGVVQLNGLWFQKGSQLFQAVIYAEKISQDMAEPFFSGLKLQ